MTTVEAVSPFMLIVSGWFLLVMSTKMLSLLFVTSGWLIVVFGAQEKGDLFIVVCCWRQKKILWTEFFSVKGTFFVPTTLVWYKMYETGLAANRS